MMLKHRLSRFACAAALAATSCGIVAGAARAADVERDNGASLSEKSFTKPSQEVDLDFSAPGLVIDVTVKEGDSVQKNQVLAKQDVSVEAANQAMYNIEANSAVEEEYAQKDLELKRVKFKRTEDLYNAKPRNATFLEVE